MRSAVRIRSEELADWTEIAALHAAAFGQSAEAELVQGLRADGDLILSLTACAEKPVGHIAFSRLILYERSSVKGCALAPMAVAADWRRQGIGSALVQEGLKRLAEAGFDLVVVLGDPNYYSRFGFTPRLAKRLETPYDGPYLQALALSGTGEEAHGPVGYARAFAELP